MLAGRFSSSMGLVGVDYGSDAMKFLQLREHQEQLQVIGATVCDLGSVTEGSRPGSDLSESIRSTFNAGGFTGRRCAVNLPRDDVYVQSLRLPVMSDVELRQAIQWEASQRFDLEHEDVKADFIRTGALGQSGEKREEILLIAASQKKILQRLEPLVEGGLRPVRVETNFTAIARTFGRRCRRMGDRSIVRAIVEVGSSGSMVIVLQGDQIAFCKPIRIGGTKFNTAVAEHLQMEVSAAAELRAGRMRQMNAVDTGEVHLDESTDRAIYEAVRPLFRDLTKEVVLCLRHYGVTFRGRPPDQIILTGGEGMEPRLDQILAEGSGIQVQFDDAAGTMESVMGQIGKTINRGGGLSGSWVVATGLSMRGIRAQTTLEEDGGTAVQTRKEAA